MRTIRGLALGTYYAAGANAARETPNSSQMRGLVYAVKNNRDPPNPKQSVQHPLHPAKRAVQVDRTNAIEYVTAMLANRIAKLTKFFKADDPRALKLVPVPSSSSRHRPSRRPASAPFASAARSPVWDSATLPCSRCSEGRQGQDHRQSENRRPDLRGPGTDCDDNSACNDDRPRR